MRIYKIIKSTFFTAMATWKTWRVTKIEILKHDVQYPMFVKPWTWVLKRWKWDVPWNIKIQMFYLFPDDGKSSIQQN